MTENSEKIVIEALAQRITSLEERLLTVELRLGLLATNSKGRVKERVLTDYPQIADTEISEFSRTCMIREWVYRNALEQFEIQNTLDQDPRFQFYNLTVDEIFSAFENNVAGVWCGGIGFAQFLLSRQFGFETYILDCGLPGSGATHISNVVRVWHNDSWRWVIQDAYYNCSYVCAKGEPLDLFKMLQLLKAGEHRSVVMLAGAPAVTRRLIANPASRPLFEKNWRTMRAGAPAECADGRLMFKVAPTLDCIISSEDGAKGLFEFLSSCKLPTELVYLYLAIFAVYPESEPGAVELKHLIRKELPGAESRG